MSSSSLLLLSVPAMMRGTDRSNSIGCTNHDEEATTTTSCCGVVQPTIGDTSTTTCTTELLTTTTNAAVTTTPVDTTTINTSVEEECRTKKMNRIKNPYNRRINQRNLNHVDFSSFNQHDSNNSSRNNNIVSFRNDKNSGDCCNTTVVIRNQDPKDDDVPSTRTTTTTTVVHKLYSNTATKVYTLREFLQCYVPTLPLQFLSFHNHQDKDDDDDNNNNNMNNNNNDNDDQHNNNNKKQQQQSMMKWNDTFQFLVQNTLLAIPFESNSPSATTRMTCYTASKRSRNEAQPTPNHNSSSNTTTNNNNNNDRCTSPPIISSPLLLLRNIRIPTSRQQSLCSLIDDCIWYLIQRRESSKLHKNTKRTQYSKSFKTKKQQQNLTTCMNHNNVLCQGHVISMNHMMNPSVQQQQQNQHQHHYPMNERRGNDSSNHSNSNSNNNKTVIQLQMNSAVDYCKTSKLFHYLHEYLGDDIVRYLLLHCSIFIPVVMITTTPIESKLNKEVIIIDDADNDNVDDKRKKNGSISISRSSSSCCNFIQIVGPPVTYLSTLQVNNNTNNNKTRKLISPPPPVATTTTTLEQRQPETICVDVEMDTDDPLEPVPDDVVIHDISTSTKKTSDHMIDTEHFCHDQEHTTNPSSESTSCIESKGGNTMVVVDANQQKHEKNRNKDEPTTQKNVKKKKKKKKRKRRQPAVPPLFATTVNESLLPTSIVPKFDLFYCDSYIDKITNGTNVFPPNHILSNCIRIRQDTTSKASSTKTTTTTTKLSSLTTNTILKICDEQPKKTNNTEGKVLQLPENLLFTSITAEYNYKDDNHNMSIMDGSIKTMNSIPSKQAQEICQQIIRRHKSFDYLRLLERCCPLPEIYLQNKKIQRNQHQQQSSSSLSHSYTTTTITQQEVDDNEKMELTLEQLSHLFTPDDCVITFLQTCVRNVFPIEFWEDDIVASGRLDKQKNMNKKSLKTPSSNQHIFLTNVIPLFTKLSRTEELPNKKLIENIQTTQMTWLLTPTSTKPTTRKLTKKRKEEINVIPIIALHNHVDEETNDDDEDGSRKTTTTKKRTNAKKLSHTEHEKLKLLVLSVYRWMIRQYLIPLIRTFFYATETEFLGKQVVYYRKPIWSVFRNVAMQKLVVTLTEQQQEVGHNNKKIKKNKRMETTNHLGKPQQKKQYLELSETDALEKLRKQQFGLSKLRLLPKATGVRPIATLCKNETIFISSSSSEEETVLLRHKKKRFIDDENEEGVGIIDDLDHNNDNMLVDLSNEDSEKVEGGNAGGLKQCDTERPKKKAKMMESTERNEKVIVHPGLSSTKCIHRLSKPPTNVALSDVFEILKYEYNQRKELFGCGLPGLHSFHNRYQSFVQEWKTLQQGTGANIQIPMYFASVDIRHCYDNIDQQHLLNVIDKVLQHDQYIIQKYNVSYPLTRMQRIARRQLKQVYPLALFRSFHQSVHAKSISNDFHNSIFLDGVNCITLTKDCILKQLTEHLTSHLVAVDGRYGKRYLQQMNGIPQGSILSSLLCNFYYGNIEERLFHNDPKSNVRSEHNCGVHMMTRMMDDFIFATTNQNELKRFLEIMERGDETLGVKINIEKTNISSNFVEKVPVVETSSITKMDLISTTSVPATKSIQNSHKNQTNYCLMSPPSQKKEDWFPWCGMLFHIQSGQILIDYTRFSQEKGLDHHLTIERANKEGENLMIKIQTFVRPRCVPLLYDNTVNDHQTQMVNFYQMFFFGAIKTAKYLLGLNEQNMREAHCPYVIKCITVTITYAYNLINRRLSQMKESKSDTTPTIKALFQHEDALSLGWQAFIDVFNKVNHLKIVIDTYHQQNKTIIINTGTSRTTSSMNNKFQHFITNYELPLHDYFAKKEMI